MVQIQFFVIKNKDWSSRTLANPPPHTSDNISFFLYSPHPPQSGRHMCIIPCKKKLSHFFREHITQNDRSYDEKFLSAGNPGSSLFLKYFSAIFEHVSLPFRLINFK